MSSLPPSTRFGGSWPLLRHSGAPGPQRLQGSFIGDIGIGVDIGIGIDVDIGIDIDIGVDGVGISIGADIDIGIDVDIGIDIGDILGGPR